MILTGRRKAKLIFLLRYNKSNHPVWFHKAEHIGGDDVEEHLVSL